MIPSHQLGHALTSILEIRIPRTSGPRRAQEKVIEPEHPAAMAGAQILKLSGRQASMVHRPHHRHILHSPHRWDREA